MSYLKVDSTAVQREVQLKHACGLIQEKMKEQIKLEKKSYPISSFLPMDQGATLPFFNGKNFGRG